MNLPTIDGRMFIVGVPRSGTTLLQSLLATHSTVTSFTESHFFARHFTYLPGLSRPVLTRDPTDRVHEFLTENNESPGEAANWFTADGRRILKTRPLLPLRTRAVAQKLFAVLDELALGRGVPSWLEKTPRHLRFIPFLERVSAAGPAPKFIHMIREGLGVVASLHEASRNWETPYDLETCVARWNTDVAFSLSRMGGPNDHFVFYEELVLRPEPTLERLLEELGLSWEPEALESFGATAEGLINRDEGWKADVGRRIRPSETSAHTLTAEQRDQVTILLQQSLYEQLVEGAASRPGTFGSSR